VKRRLLSSKGTCKPGSSSREDALSGKERQQSRGKFLGSESDFLKSHTPTVRKGTNQQVIPLKGLTPPDQSRGNRRVTTDQEATGRDQRSLSVEGLYRKNLYRKTTPIKNRKGPPRKERQPPKNIRKKKRALAPSQKTRSTGTPN